MKLGRLPFSVKLLITMIIVVCLWRAFGWLRERYHRFPLHRLPAWNALEALRRSRSADDISDAKAAIDSFVIRYGALPLVQTKREEQFGTTLGHELNGVPPGLEPLNKQGLVFWELPAGQQLDGWGRRYHFYMDHDGDGVVHPGGVAVARSFAIWSDGPNGKDEGGGGDDLRSW